VIESCDLEIYLIMIAAGEKYTILRTQPAHIMCLPPLDIGHAFDLLKITGGDAANIRVGHIKALLALVGTFFQYPAFLNGNLFAHIFGCAGIIFAVIRRLKYGFKIHKLTPLKKKSAVTKKTLPFDVTDFEKAVLKTLGAERPPSRSVRIHLGMKLCDLLLLFCDAVINLS
jgi:hypothetical protein